MSENLVIALQITAIGMGLVFGAIMLLWGIMAAIMRLTADPTQEDLHIQKTELELKQHAAAAAVMVAIAGQVDAEPREFPLPPTALVSAWQAVMRTKMLNKRGPVR